MGIFHKTECLFRWLECFPTKEENQEVSGVEENKYKKDKKLG